MPTDSPSFLASSNSRRRIGLLSTYPPKLCGLATFSAALQAELTRAGDRVDVVCIDDGHPSSEKVPVGRAVLVNGSPASVLNAAAVLSRCDVAIVQHEYGIYGGVDGDEVLDLLTALDVPSIVILHTVPLSPTPNQKVVLEQVCAIADRVVVMTGTAADRLLDLYDVDSAKVVLIPHGAATAAPVLPLDEREAIVRRPQLLTWGLLGPGKGIEHVITAVALLADLRPRVRYTVAGVTHPKVLARDGDQYRQSLIRRAWATGVVSSVDFDDTYRDVPTLTRFIASASVVVLPYDSRDQVTSGVLVDAIAAGRPVIATAFPHAVEMLSGGAGIIVPHGDPVALAAAIRSTVSDRGRLESMTAEARRLAPSLKWSTVAARYQKLCDELVRIDQPVAS